MKRGTEGTIRFLESLNNYVKTRREDPEAKELLSPTMPIEEGVGVISLTVDSTHYIGEELKSRSEQLSWKPDRLSHFLIIFLDHLLWLTYFLMKFQSLRLGILLYKKPSSGNRLKEKAPKLLKMDFLRETQRGILRMRKEVIAEYAVNRGFQELKKKSIPAIGLGAVTLLMMVVLWPFVGSFTNVSTKYLLFSFLYAAGVTSIIQTLIFMFGLFWTSSSRAARGPAK